MDALDRAHAYMARTNIAYTTAGIAPDRRKRHGHGWTAALGIVALALVGMAIR